MLFLFVSTDVCKGKEERLDIDVSNVKPADDKTWVIPLPDEIEIMGVTFKTDGNPGPFTVRILDRDGNEVFGVSPQLQCRLLKSLCAILKHLCRLRYPIRTYVNISGNFQLNTSSNHTFKTWNDNHCLLLETTGSNLRLCSACLHCSTCVSLEK